MVFVLLFCEEQLIKMIPNPSENKYRLHAFLAIIAWTQIGIVAQFTTIKSLVNFLKVTPLSTYLLHRKWFSVRRKLTDTPSHSLGGLCISFPQLNSVSLRLSILVIFQKWLNFRF